MTGYAAFLRAINVGGRRVTNDMLRAEFEALGYRDVRTLLASGNVTFTTGRRSDSGLEAEIGEQLRTSLGFDVRTFVRSTADLERILTASPFGTDASVDGTTMHIMFLTGPPDAEAVAAVTDASRPGDLLAVEGAELHWLREGRMTDTALDWKPLAKLLGETTTRTAATVRKAAALLEGTP